MDLLRRILRFTLLLGVLFGNIDADVCTKKGPCSCIFPNGTGIDLAPAMQTTFYIADKFDVKKNETEYELHTYYFHPCLDILPKVNSTGPNDTCGIPLSICRHVKTMNKVAATDTYKFDSDIYNFMGTVNYTEFSADGKSIIYANGPSSTVVMLNCAETANQLIVYSLDDPNRVVLAFYSKDACLKVIEEEGRSFGSTLLIIFFSVVIFYLALGVLTRKFLMGATGIEVIPNLNFWMDLPNLVKDGWAFARAGFKLPTRSGPVTSPDPNSYDSI